MTDDLVDAISSLASLMNEETARLGAPGRAADLGELVTAKTRVAGALEGMVTRRAREDADWIARLDTEQRERLLAALAELREAATSNAAVLDRQIELSRELMTAVAAEVKRLSGSRHTVYGAAGGLAETDSATPITVNSRF